MYVTGVALGGGGKQVLAGVAAEVIPIIVGTCAWWNLSKRVTQLYIGTKMLQ